MLGSCMEIDSCTGAGISSGNCPGSFTCCVPNPSTPPITTHKILTKEKFLKIAGNTTRNNVLYSYLVDSMEKANVKSLYEIAAYLSQLMGETKNFRIMESAQLENDFDSAIGNGKNGKCMRMKNKLNCLISKKLIYCIQYR